MAADVVRTSVPRDEVRVWDMDGGAARSSYPDGGAELGYVTAIAWSPDSRYVAYGWYFEPAVRQVWLWELATGKTRLLTTEDTVTTLAFSPDGKQLAGGGRSCSVMVWDVSP